MDTEDRLFFVLLGNERKGRQSKGGGRGERSSERPFRGREPERGKRERKLPHRVETAPQKVKPISGLGDQWLEPVCGTHAVGSLFHCKPFIVERLFFEEELAPMFGEICRFLAKERKAYRVVSNEELSKIAGTRHHGGVVAIARRRPLEYGTPKAAEFWAKEGYPMLLLDGIGNTHNLGGLARTAAFYGIEKALIADTRKQARPSESAYRVARGGLDMLDLRLVENIPSFLKGARKSYFVIGLDIEGQPLPDFISICPDEKLEMPVALVIGNEETGLSDATRGECDALVGIPGCGAVDRLNVVAETALLIQKYLVES